VAADLDGCVLDARTYEAGPAAGAIREAVRAGVIVLLATSKTRAEVAALERTLGVRVPAAIEGGAGLWLPPRTLIALAAPYDRVRRAFVDARRKARIDARGFGDADVGEVARRTGLSRAEAARAKRREFDEPFWLERPASRAALSRFRGLARRRGLAVSKGGLFHHLHGRCDKGRALARLLRALGIRRARVLAFGDSPQDLPMLRRADFPFVVPKPDGRPDPALRRGIPRARLAPAPGPEGVARVLRGFLASSGA
jgi:mannosyl-3-phosphoglycerate phosphatase